LSAQTSPNAIRLISVAIVGSNLAERCSSDIHSDCQQQTLSDGFIQRLAPLLVHLV
jgi:hypothetical protein